MSTISTTSSSLPRAYISARRNRLHNNNNLTPSSLSNDYNFSTSSSLKSFLPIQSEERNYLTNTDALQTQQEERASVKHFSYTTPIDEQQLHLQEKQKAKGFSPASSPSSFSSLFLSPTTHNVTPLSDYDRSPLSFVKEQQHSHHPSHQYEQLSYWQPSNSENQNNQLLLLEKFQQQREQQKQQQPSTNSTSIHNQNFDLSDVSEENSSFSSSCSLSDTIAETNNNYNQSHLLTSTPILPSHHPTTDDDDIFPALSSYKTYNHKPLPLTLDSTTDQSSTISTVGLITDLQRKADAYQLKNMSSRYSTTTHPYDQRVTDQGNKYLIQLKTDEYQENEFTISPHHSVNQLIIDAKHREEDSLGGYIHRELHKIFNIPKHVDMNRHTYSYNKHTQELTVEIPYLQTSSFTSPIRSTTEPSTHSYGNINRTNLPTSSIRSDYHNDSNNTSGLGSTATDSLLRSSNSTTAPIYESSIRSTKPFDFDSFHRSAFRPQIIHATSNTNDEKKLLMTLDLSDYQAEDIKISVKDRELIVNAERKIETDTRKSRSSFFQSTSLPPQADIEHLQSNFTDGKLVIEAPYLDQKRIQATSGNQGTNWPTVTETQQEKSVDDPFQQRTEKVTEYVRRRPI